MATGEARPDAPARGVFLYVALHAAVAAAYVNYAARAFGMNRWLVLVHVPLVAALILTAVLGPALLLGNARLRNTRWIKLAVIAPAALLSAGLAVLYAADLAANVVLGSNVTHPLAWLWLSDWWAGGNILSLSPWVAAATIAGAAAILVAHWACAPALVGHLERLVVAAGQMAAARGRLAPVATALAVLGVAGLVARDLAWRTPRSEFLSADPILAFLRSGIAVYDDAYLAVAARLADEEPRARAAYVAPAAFDRRHVIVIIVDSLRADHLPVYGYPRDTTPFLSSLQAQGRLQHVAMATSACAESNCGILATLTSKALQRQVPQNFKLHELLADRGYKTYFILSSSHDWHGLRDYYGREQTLYFDGRDARRHAGTDDGLLFEGLERVPDADGPAFFYFHLMSTHHVGVKQARHRRFHPSDVTNDWATLFSGAYDRTTVVNNYDNGVVQADATIESLFASLDAKGYLRDSVAVILSDHGESLGEGGRYGHVASLHQERILIPMLIYDPSGTRYANLDFATQVDVAPTLMRRLGLPVPQSWEGLSLLDGPARTESTHQTRLTSACYGRLERSSVGTVTKYVSCPSARSEMFFDVSADPGETRNLIATADRTVLARARQAIARMRGR